MPPLRLHLNEHTGGCSPAVLEALRDLTAHDIACYPDYDHVESETAAHLGVDRQMLLLVNGLDEGLHVVAALALRPGRDGAYQSVIPVPAFEMFAICTEAAGGTVVAVPPRAGFAFPGDGIRAALGPRARLLFLTNPDNPTGRTVPPATIAALAAEHPRVTVMVDEAYIDFGGESVLPWCAAHRNLIVGRTFAKAYGLAALRAGALLAHPETLAPLRRALPPYSLNVAAATALRAAIGDRSWRQSYIREATASRRMIEEFCRARAIPYHASGANFVLVRLGPRAPELVAGLAARGILIRDRSTQPGCEGCVRITAGLADHTRQCLDALSALL